MNYRTDNKPSQSPKNRSDKRRKEKPVASSSTSNHKNKKIKVKEPPGNAFIPPLVHNPLPATANNYQPFHVNDRVETSEISPEEFESWFGDRKNETL